MPDRFYILAFISAILLTSSCSVKENRSECPTCLGVDISGCRGYGDNIVISAWSEGVLSLSDGIPCDFPGDYVEYQVPKGSLALSAVCAPGLDACSGRVCSDPGREADSVYASVSSFVTSSEYCFRKVEMFKQFASVCLVIENISEFEPGGIRVEVSGSDCGFAAQTLEPIRGGFNFSPVMSGNGVCRFRLYRQLDEGLALTLTFKDGRRVTLDLGNELERCGYDWTEPELRDIDLSVTIGLASVEVTVGGWSVAGHFSVNI